MAENSPKAVSWITGAVWVAGLAVFAGFMTVRTPEAVCTPSHAATAGGDPERIQAELESWERMWTEIEVEGVKALDRREGPAAGAVYAGDTCGMRYRRLYPGVDPGVRDRLALAAFANDPDVKKRILESLSESPDARLRARVSTELARIALRRGDFAAAAAALDRTAVEELPAPCEADAHYLRGRIALGRGDSAAALDAFATAAARDPGFWNAHSDRIPLLVAALHEPGQAPAACMRRARRLVEAVGQLPQLADDTRQFAALALSLERLGARSSAALLATGLAWRWAGREERGRGILAKVSDAPDLLPVVCEREMRARAVLALEASP